MKRLKRAAVRSGWEIRRSLAARPTRTAPSPSTLTALGVRKSPAALGISSLRPFRQTAARELVVPRSIPIIAICDPRFPRFCCPHHIISKLELQELPWGRDCLIAHFKRGPSCRGRRRRRPTGTRIGPHNGPPRGPAPTKIGHFPWDSLGMPGRGALGSGPSRRLLSAPSRMALFPQAEGRPFFGRPSKCFFIASGGKRW